MITIKQIIDWSKPHGPIGGRRTCIRNSAVELSIVGGVQGLYGDFEETFEIALIDTASHNFVTKYFFPDNNDDVVAYLSSDELESLANKIFHSGFQVC